MSVGLPATHNHNSWNSARFERHWAHRLHATYSQPVMHLFLAIVSPSLTMQLKSNNSRMSVWLAHREREGERERCTCFQFENVGEEGEEDFQYWCRSDAPLWKSPGALLLNGISIELIRKLTDLIGWLGRWKLRLNYYLIPIHLTKIRLNHAP